MILDSNLDENEGLPPLWSLLLDEWKTTLSFLQSPKLLHMSVDRWWKLLMWKVM